MRLRISIRGSVRPSVRPAVGPSVGPYVPRYFRTANMAVFEKEKSSKVITNNGTVSDDEVDASDVPLAPVVLVHLLTHRFKPIHIPSFLVRKIKRSKTMNYIILQLHF